MKEPTQKPKRTTVATYAHELLRRVVRLGKADRFGLMEVCPGDATWYLPALARLASAGYVEKVVERVGVWHYKLTARGVAAAELERLPKSSAFAKSEED